VAASETYKGTEPARHRGATRLLSREEGAARSIIISLRDRPCLRMVEIDLRERLS
jgi:hypothetical protein